MEKKFLAILALLLTAQPVLGEEITLKWNFQSSSGIWTVDITEDGSHAVAGSYDNYVYFFDGAGNLLWSYKTGDTVWSVALSEKGDYVVAGSKDRHVYLFSRTGELLWSYKTGDTVWSVDISRDGSYIVAGSYDNNVYFFDRGGRLLWKFKAFDIVLSTAISGDGEYVVAGSYDNNVYFFDRGGRLLWKFKAFDIVLSTAISGDGEYVVAGSYDNNVYFFDRGGRLLWKFKARDEIWGVDISTDGRYVVAGSRDNAFYQLNALGELLSKYTTKYFVSSVATSANGEYSVAGSYDNNVYYLVKTTARPPKPTYPKVVALKTVVDRVIEEGGTTKVEVTLQNIGDGLARNVRLVDRLPRGLELAAGNLTWAGELEPGGVEVVEYVVRAGPLLVREEVTYELPGVNVTYEDTRGIFYSFTGASISLTVIPRAPVEEPVAGVGVGAEIITAVKENRMYLLLVAVLAAAAAALIHVKRRREKALRMERVMLLRRLKGEAAARPVYEKERAGVRPLIPFRGGYEAYKRETLNLLRNMKSMVRSGDRPRTLGTFPEKPGEFFVSAVPYWVRSLFAGKERKAHRERNVALLQSIKKSIG
jgi:WD40 repeat protein